MTKNINEPGDFKRVCTSVWGAAFFLTLGSFLMDVIVFSRMGAFFGSFGYFCILSLYYAGWLIVLRLGRAATVMALGIYFILFLVFKEYYKFHVYALEPQMIWRTAWVGLRAGWANKDSLFDGAFFVVLGYLIFEIMFVLRHKYCRLKQAALGVFVGGMLFVGAIQTGVLLVEGIFQTLYPNLYFAYKHNMVYQITWPKNVLFAADKAVQNAFEARLKQGNGDILTAAVQDDVTIDFSNIKHVFLIQAESLSDRAIKPHNGVQAMPFLAQKMQQSVSVVDPAHHHCLGSANTDFMMMTGQVMNCRQSAFVVFDSYPPAFYGVNKTLPQRFKEKGFHTAFLHGFNGAYFNRIRHYAPMGFEVVLFNENFPADVARTAWGVDDKTVLERAAELAGSADKTFVFVITAGMHPPYTVPEKTAVLWPKATHDVENYLNAAYVLDNGLKSLYDKAPNDSLFIVYGDHNSPDVGGMDTPFVVYYKGDNPPTIPMKQPGFDETIRYMQSILD